MQAPANDRICERLTKLRDAGNYGGWVIPPLKYELFQCCGACLRSRILVAGSKAPRPCPGAAG